MKDRFYVDQKDAASRFDGEMRAADKESINCRVSSKNPTKVGVFMGNNLLFTADAAFCRWLSKAFADTADHLEGAPWVPRETT